jgi:predicted 3-demethylubiquinone-9 3-methyltransferase (glyoxalase superfamily)
MRGIDPFLWFDGKAEEAARFYTSVFRDAKMGTLTRCGEGGPGPKGSVMTATFELGGQRFVALNGGPQYRFTPAISFVVNCETQAEVDELWEKLSAGEQANRCGWLTDRYGVSWQIVPVALVQMLGDRDPERSRRVMQAMLHMDKLDIQALKRAYEG